MGPQIPIDQFLRFLDLYQIPPYPPLHTSRNGFDLYYNGLEQIKARGECTKRGMWAIVDGHWTARLAEWIGDRTVLEIMSGAGWLAKALSQHGVKITATDNFSSHHVPKRVFDVRQMAASKAVREIKADVLLVSWPPYRGKAVSRACKLWGGGKPIVYIGEIGDGCNATPRFFEQFEPIDLQPDIPLMQWWGIHDKVVIGHWKGLR